MAKSFFEKTGHLKLILILIAFGYFFLMFGNGIISMTHPDEVFYIQSAREMVENNKWFTPMIFDDVQFEKPFIGFTLFAFGVKYFGLNPFWCRFFPGHFFLSQFQHSFPAQVRIGTEQLFLQFFNLAGRIRQQRFYQGRHRTLILRCRGFTAAERQNQRAAQTDNKDGITTHKYTHSK